MENRPLPQTYRIGLISSGSLFLQEAPLGIPALPSLQCWPTCHQLPKGPPPSTCPLGALYIFIKQKALPILICGRINCFLRQDGPGSRK